MSQIHGCMQIQKLVFLRHLVSGWKNHSCKTWCFWSFAKTIIAAAGFEKYVILKKVRKTLIMRTFVCYNILGGFSLLQSEILAKIFLLKILLIFFRILLPWRNFVMPYEKKSNSELLLEQLDTLPHFCSGLLLNRAAEREISTRLSYARDLNTFFPYIIRTKPE